MRIAAKRLRYVLEVTALVLRRRTRRRRCKRAKELQDLLGEIHDCDEMLPLVRARRPRAARRGRRRRSSSWPPTTTTWRRRWARRVAARRRLRAASRCWRCSSRRARMLLFERFLDRWKGLERNDFRARLERALAERPEPGEAQQQPIRPTNDGQVSSGGARMTSVTPTRSRLRRRARTRAVGLARPTRACTSTASSRGSTSTTASSSSPRTRRCPLLERVKFCAIYTSNLDEFFMVRVAGLHDQVDAGIDARGPDGLHAGRDARRDPRARRASSAGARSRCLERRAASRRWPSTASASLARRASPTTSARELDRALPAPDLPGAHAARRRPRAARSRTSPTSRSPSRCSCATRSPATRPSRA